MHNHSKLLTHPAMRILREAIRRDLQLKLGVGLVLLLSGLALVTVFFRQYHLLAVLGLGIALPGAWCLREYLLRPRVADDRLWQVLHCAPDHIVWVFTQEERLMPFGMLLSERGTLFVMLLDGSELSLAMPVRKLRLAMHFLRRLLPHSAFGFSVERRRQFESDPASLLKYQ